MKKNKRHCAENCNDLSYQVILSLFVHLPLTLSTNFLFTSHQLMVNFLKTRLKTPDRISNAGTLFYIYRIQSFGSLIAFSDYIFVVCCWY